jgi:hypothetical protein
VRVEQGAQLELGHGGHHSRGRFAAATRGS